MGAAPIYRYIGNFGKALLTKKLSKMGLRVFIGYLKKKSGVTNFWDFHKVFAYI